MSSIKSILITSLAALAAASPIAPRQNGTITGVTFFPNTISQWNSGNSRVAYDTSRGLIQRTPGSGNEISTLHTFAIPSQYADRTCAIKFNLLSSSSSSSGTGQAQLYYDFQAAALGANSPGRDSQIGTVQVVNGGSAVFATPDGTVVGSSFNVPCSKLISTPWLELAPAGDQVSVSWPKGDGLSVAVL